MPEISVVVVNWNGKHFLEACLSALRHQTFRDFESILVDNASEDGSLEYVRAQFPEVHVISLDRNVGFAQANNIAYRQTRGEMIALLNNDTEADPNWLAEVHKASREFPAAASFASKMLYFDDRSKIENCGFAVTPAGLTIDLGRDQHDGPDWVEPRKVFGACGGAAIYRRHILEEIGFLDPDFFMTYEDVDWSFRAQLRGYDCEFIPRAIVHHRYRATMAKNPARQVFFSQRNIEFVYLKNMPLGLMLRSLPQRFLYEVGGAIYFFKIGVGWAYLRAKVDALQKLFSVLKKRRQLQKSRTRTNAQLLLAMQHDNWLRSKWNKLSSAWRRSTPPAARNPKLIS